MLVAQIRRAGAEPVALGIARDERCELAAKIRQGLRYDVLILSGGVSEGVLDLVPSELAAAGVRQVFHKVNVKPGKPVWYGRTTSNPAASEQPGCSTCHVFGLPGNPVSSMVCFELFTRPAIRRLMGFEPAAPQPVRARLATAHVARGDRPTYHPSRLELTETGPVVDPVAWQGSSDLRATVDANAMALFPREGTYRAGEVVEAYCWD
jgi:molybdopterin molybdotransferase